MIEYRLEDDNKVIFRPSGTEPKVKAYLFAKGATRAGRGRAPSCRRPPKALVRQSETSLVSLED